MDELARESHPVLPDRQYITEFVWAYELHIAASGTSLLRNRPVPDMTAEKLAARNNILNLNVALLIDARDKALDKFCASWIKHRAKTGN